MAESTHANPPQRVHIAQMGKRNLYCVGVVAPEGEPLDAEAADRETKARGLRYLTDWEAQPMEDREGFTLWTRAAEKV